MQSRVLLKNFKSLSINFFYVCGTLAVDVRIPKSTLGRNSRIVGALDTNLPHISI